MCAKNILMQLLYNRLIRNNFKPSDFEFKYHEGYCTLSTINMHHTVFLKIRVKSDVESETKILPLKEVINRTFNYESGSDYTKRTAPLYYDRFDDLIFDKEGYVACDYTELSKIFRVYSYGGILIKQPHRGDAVFSIDLLKSVFFERPESEVFMKVRQDDGIVFINYEFSCFDVYAAVAPRVVDHGDADVILRLE